MGVESIKGRNCQPRGEDDIEVNGARAVEEEGHVGGEWEHSP